MLRNFPTVVFTLVLGMSAASNICSQQITTVVDHVEGDEVEVKGEYKVLFDAGNYWIEAKRTEDGFTLPDAFSKTEWITFIFAFGDQKLFFEKIHISKFGQVWIVGVDTFPFLEENVPKKYAKRTISAYYIHFTAGHGTRVVVNRFKTRRNR